MPEQARHIGDQLVHAFSSIYSQEFVPSSMFWRAH